MNTYQEEQELLRTKHKLKYPTPGSLSSLEEWNKMWDEHKREQTIIMVFFQIATVALFIWVFCFSHS